MKGRKIDLWWRPNSTKNHKEVVFCKILSSNKAGKKKSGIMEKITFRLYFYLLIKDCIPTEEIHREVVALCTRIISDVKTAIELINTKVHKDDIKSGIICTKGLHNSFYNFHYSAMCL